MSPHAHLEWGVKASFVAYVRQAPDGSVVAGSGAGESSGVFRFPLETCQAAGALGFAGEVRFRAHGGALDVTLADPEVHLGEHDTLWLRCEVDGESERVRFARLQEVSGSPGDGLRSWTAVLTEAGATVLGPLQYYDGVQIDPLVVAERASTPA
jgi:hypothetical protein